MRYSVSFTKISDADLDDIADYIGQFDPIAAIRFIGQLRERATSVLAIAPHGGSRLESIRYFPLGSYVVAYDVDENAKVVTVLMICRGDRDWRRIVESRLRPPPLDV
ncbi:type II toxin-antitoxin system RelE/ParE family toxin [Alsobacter sp. KACC 23698]|uniref:Type II toxin-antitoxin system RelE/ParE family toxin n=1 Tax=Alsobacter sp. KACC 23698 TaxID=3149229 RepID=A0AAU7JFK7_9HYPH